MEAIVHYPELEEAGEELSRKIAGVHAELVAGLVYSLPCSDRQLCELLHSVIEEWQNKKNQSI